MVTPSGQLSNEVLLSVTPPPATAAPAISTYPDPSANVYSEVTPFLTNQGANFSAPTETYLTSQNQALAPLNPSNLKQALKAASSGLKWFGAEANIALFVTSDTVIDDAVGSTLGALLPYLHPSASADLESNAALTAADIAKEFGKYGFGKAGLTGALISADLYIWTDILPYEIDNFVAADPPDPNYHVVVTPNTVSAPTLPLSGDAGLDALFADSQYQKLKAASLLNAATVTYNRYSTAYVAGDAQSAGLQLEALLNFLHTYDRVMQAAANDLASLKTKTAEAGYSSASIDPAAVATLQKRLSTVGVSAEVSVFLGDHGFTSAQIEAARRQFLTFNPSKATDTVTSELSQISDTALHATSETPSDFGNISTRLNVGTGDNVLIGGFIITGAIPKRVIIRAIGPSLLGQGISGAIADPYLELYDSSGQIIPTNDNWAEDADKEQIIEAGLAPSNVKESAILRTLSPGAYTALVRGANKGSGVALMELYDLDSGIGSRLANISTRGRVQTADNVMIAGVIVIGKNSEKVLVRAIGPSLAQAGVSGVLADPVLELHDANGSLITTNDNWRSSQQAEIQATGIAPTDDRESAILKTLAPGDYTAVVRGKNNTTGVALIEAYQLDN